MRPRPHSPNEEEQLSFWLVNSHYTTLWLWIFVLYVWCIYSVYKFLLPDYTLHYSSNCCTILHLYPRIFMWLWRKINNLIIFLFISNFCQYSTYTMRSWHHSMLVWFVTVKLVKSLAERKRWRRVYWTTLPSTSFIRCTYSQTFFKVGRSLTVDQILYVFWRGSTIVLIIKTASSVNHSQ